MGEIYRWKCRKKERKCRSSLNADTRSKWKEKKSRWGIELEVDRKKKEKNETNYRNRCDDGTRNNLNRECNQVDGKYSYKWRGYIQMKKKR